MGGPYLSATTSTCDHRVYHVVVVALVSVITGLVAGIGCVVFGQTPLTAVASGGAVLAFTYGAGMTAASHVSKRQQ
ncbi:hypothetical protein AQJ67_35475 [Streptomyces caeruleatus]|uniref:Uncharacterized protein n=1 Tax=Streptomyces caeruleatus TaxID=661399 RepID=A0A117RK67_9ACTN|nr:hypothetical protein AQJ67_35475 [Streptomyces caeruleatus]